MLCTGSLPAWVGEVVRACPFLFPLEARDFYTSVTALGVSRALHAMQRLQARAADPAAPDVRIGRIQRDKIRVPPPPPPPPLPRPSPLPLPPAGPAPLPAARAARGLRPCRAQYGGSRDARRETLAGQRGSAGHAPRRRRA